MCHYVEQREFEKNATRLRREEVNMWDLVHLTKKPPASAMSMLTSGSRW
jgi:hypothetical protein